MRLSKYNIEHTLDSRIVGSVNPRASGEGADQVHQNIDAVKTAHGLVHDAAGGIPAGKFGGHGGEPRIWKIGGLNRSGDSDYMSPGREECGSYESSQPAFRSGDYGDLIVELFHSSVNTIFWRAG